MTTLIQYMNLAGVVALAALCSVQWQANRSANLHASALEKTRLEQAATIRETDRQAKAFKADLDALRKHLTQKTLECKEASSNLAMVQHAVRLLHNERDQLKESVTNWANAIAARDSRIKNLGEQLNTMADERNETVLKFNDLARKYEDVLRDLNERTQRFNELAQRRLNNATSKE